MFSAISEWIANRSMRRTLKQLWTSARYAVAVGALRPSSRVLDEYFETFPDAYQMVQNGPARVMAIAKAVDENIGPCDSILDVGCYEGMVLRHLSDHLSVKTIIGLDSSEVVLQRAREACRGIPGIFQQWDLNHTYENPKLGLPAEVVKCDLVLVCDVLFYLGRNCSYLWSNPTRQLAQKQDFLKALQKYAHKGVIVQHFGAKHRDAIGAVVESCGGRLLNKEWGIYLMKGTTERL